MATFTAAAIQSAFIEIAEDLEVSVQRASYLTSLVIAILGGAPLFWRPLSHTYGRRPTFLVSLLCSLVGNIGCAVSPTYGTMGLCRAITAFFICPAASIGTAVVSETFFRNERARYMGVWTTMVTLGVPVAPLIFGFVAMRTGYRWIYWILAMVSFRSHRPGISADFPRPTVLSLFSTACLDPKPGSNRVSNRKQTLHSDNSTSVSAASIPNR